jgi:class 3 adenylate cyclase
MAEPGGVLVGPVTQQLCKDFFEFAFAGEHPVKGFREPIAIWKVLRESTIETRFAAAHAAAPIVGRERELALLHDAWTRATQGNGHVALLVGEAGMGKSRLLEALAEQVTEPHTLSRCQCSPYHRNSVLFPLKILLRNRLDLNRESSVQDALDRISRFLKRVGDNKETSVALLAEFLEVSSEASARLDMTPIQRKEETLSILENVLMAPLDGPALLLLEDAHWSDQTTQTLVARLLKRIDRESALVLITYRPELKTNWADHPQATQISCKQIAQHQCAMLIRQVASAAQLDDAIVQQIVARSDGVPLFVTELTKAVMHLGTLDAGKVPLTLKDSLTARLDRLGRAKDIAQIASVIGRQFSYALLASVAGSDEGDLRPALARLRESGLIFEAGSEDAPSYSFNHSLVQEAAYESLARSRRQSLHEAIAKHLEETGDDEPTVTAYHYSAAGNASRSCHFWLLAADRAGDRLALAESIANLHSALAEAERVIDPGERAQLKVDAQLKLGTTIAIHKGPVSAEAGSALELARTLAQEANAQAQLFQATWGLYLNAARNRKFDKAAVIGAQLRDISNQLPDEYKYETLHHQWGYTYFTGQTAKTLEFTAQGIDKYDRNLHHKFAYTFAGHDAGVCAYCVRAIMLGLAGRADTVRPTLDQGLALAHSLQHPLTSAFTSLIGTFALHAIGDAGGCREFAAQLELLSEKYDLAATRSIGRFMLGAAEALEGDVASGLKSMEPTFEPTLAYGFLGTLPGVIFADALTRAGRGGEALALTRRLLDESSPPEAGIFTPELWRMRGGLVLRDSSTNIEQAEHYLRTALRVASDQGAAVYRMRAATSLGRLLLEHGRYEAARSVLDELPADLSAEWYPREIAAAAQLRSGLR